MTAIENGVEIVLGATRTTIICLSTIAQPRTVIVDRSCNFGGCVALEQQQPCINIPVADAVRMT